MKHVTTTLVFSEELEISLIPLVELLFCIEEVVIIGFLIISLEVVVVVELKLEVVLVEVELELEVVLVKVVLEVVLVEVELVLEVVFVEVVVVVEVVVGGMFDVRKPRAVIVFVSAFV